MDCSLPPALTDQQLLEALDGTANQQVTQHIQHCPACQARSQTLAGLQTRLKVRLFRATCPSTLELGEFFLRRLPAPQRLVVSQHVRHCPHCTSELAQISEFMKDELTAPQVESAVITVNLQPASKGLVTVLGQVAAEAQDLWTGAVVTLQQAGMPIQITAVNDLGAFRFEAIPPGESEITLTSLHDTAIKIPTLDLRL
jgi:hypothetical protein